MSIHNSDVPDTVSKDDTLAVHGTIFILELILAMYICFVCSGECIMAIGAVKIFAGVLLLCAMNVYSRELADEIGTGLPVASVVTGFVWIAVGFHKQRVSEEQYQRMEQFWSPTKRDTTYELVPKEEGDLKDDTDNTEDDDSDAENQV